VREVTIRSRFRFRVRSHDEQELVPETELLREMDVSYAEAQALAKDAEVEMLFRSMEADAVQQIMRRLAMIKNVAPLPGAAPAAASATTSAGTAAPVPAKPASGSGW
jgi:LPS-assembly lipoprotein